VKKRTFIFMTRMTKYPSEEGIADPIERYQMFLAHKHSLAEGKRA
jgi:hypothetical protein